jgi:uncharacterized protein
MEIKMARHNETIDIGFEVKKETVTAEGDFEGYGSTFGGAPDSGGDIIAKGCFAKTLKNKGRNGNGIALLWSHDSRAPIGVWRNIQEDDKGLFCQGTIHPKAQPDGIPVLDIMRMGGIRGLSIGYNTVKSSTDEKKKVRTLEEVDLWEISPVTFPMNTRASITAVKNIYEARTPRELEDALREADMPRDLAKYLVKLCKPGLRDAGGTTGGQDMNAMLRALRDVNQKLEADLTVEGIRRAIETNF